MENSQIEQCNSIIQVLRQQVRRQMLLWIAFWLYAVCMESANITADHLLYPEISADALGGPRFLSSDLSPFAQNKLSRDCHKHITGMQNHDFGWMFGSILHSERLRRSLFSV